MLILFRKIQQFSLINVEEKNLKFKLFAFASLHLYYLVKIIFVQAGHKVLCYNLFLVHYRCCKECCCMSDKSFTRRLENGTLLICYINNYFILFLSLLVSSIFFHALLSNNSHSILPELI